MEIRKESENDDPETEIAVGFFIVGKGVREVKH